MNTALLIAASLLVALGIAHSYLGERYILIRLFRRGDLPRLFGETEFTQRVLRFAWHLTTIAWWGLAALLIEISAARLSTSTALRTIAVTAFVSAAIIAFASRGKHLAWPVFVAIAVICYLAQ
jgi:hypothetical protein